MSLVVFSLLAVLAAVAIGYPLFRSRPAAQPDPGISDAQIDGAVRRLREARKRAAAPRPKESCPVCNAPYQPGDRFCMRCGQTLAPQEAAPSPARETVCPSCGAALREDDLFCARCGQRLVAPSDPGAGGERPEEVQS
jgi:predicted amidophosphoribosyltransferase